MRAVKEVTTEGRDAARMFIYFPGEERAGAWPVSTGPARKSDLLFEAEAVAKQQGREGNSVGVEQISGAALKSYSLCAFQGTVWQMS